MENRELEVEEWQPDKNAARKKEMQEKVNAKPLDYAMCLNETCALKGVCLHGMEAAGEAAEEPFLHVVNPREYEAGKQCQQFRPSDGKVSYAIGFRKQRDEIKKRNLLGCFVAVCRLFACRSVLYDMIAGNRLISPDEQQSIIACASRVGYEFPANGFDDFVEGVAW